MNASVKPVIIDYGAGTAQVVKPRFIAGTMYSRAEDLKNGCNMPRGAAGVSWTP
jgi:hypothetical protein